MLAKLTASTAILSLLKILISILPVNTGPVESVYTNGKKIGGNANAPNRDSNPRAY